MVEGLTIEAIRFTIYHLLFTIDELRDFKVEPEQEETGGIWSEVVGHLRKRRRRRLGLRMTAMIDVIFLLLTFFVLTARFRTPEEFLPIHLPTADAAVQRFGVIEPLEIDISADQAGCVVRIGQLETVRIEAGRGAEGLAAFANKLTDILSQQKRTAGDPIEIRCADEIKWDYLMKIYNVLQAMGINDITFRMTE